MKEFFEVFNIKPEIYRQADIEAPEGYEVPYIDSNGEKELLRGVVAKIMLMRDIINKIGAGGQLTLGLE